MNSSSNFGLITGIKLREKGEGLSLELLSADGQSITLSVCLEALRGLWAYLTQILYPRAGDQLTESLSTVKESPDSVAPGVVFKMTAAASPDQPDQIEIDALSKSDVRSFTISHETGYDLWVALENLLDQV